jgi:hypothetical protein
MNILLDIADPRDHFSGRSPKYPDHSPVRLKNPQNQFNEGRLAAAVRPYYDQKIARSNRKVHFFQNRIPGVGKPKILYLYHVGIIQSLYLKAFLNASACCLKFSIQFSASGFAKTTCPPISLAICWALFAENCGCTKTTLMSFSLA